MCIVLSIGSTEAAEKQNPKMTTVKFTLNDKPSNSKGWGRYSVSQGDRRVIESRTGNQWVSASHEGQAEAGSEIVLTAQVMLREGKYNKETIYSEVTKLVVAEGATAEIYYRPGSQGIRITVEGARRA